MQLCHSLPSIKYPTPYMQKINMERMTIRKPVNQGQDVNENRFMTVNLLPKVSTNFRSQMMNLNFDKMTWRGDAWIKKAENPDYNLIDTAIYKFPKTKKTTIKPLPRNRSVKLL
jgi:hypothetical protein